MDVALPIKSQQGRLNRKLNFMNLTHLASIFGLVLLKCVKKDQLVKHFELGQSSAWWQSVTMKQSVWLRDTSSYLILEMFVLFLLVMFFECYSLRSFSDHSPSLKLQVTFGWHEDG